MRGQGKGEQNKRRGPERMLRIHIYVHYETRQGKRGEKERERMGERKFDGTKGTGQWNGKKGGHDKRGMTVEGCRILRDGSLKGTRRERKEEDGEKGSI